MKTLIRLSIFFLSIFVFCTVSHSKEINALTVEDLYSMGEDVEIPSVSEPASVQLEEALGSALAPGKNGMPPVIITVPGLRFDEVGPGILELSTLKKIWHFFFPGKRDEIGPVIAEDVEKFNQEYFMIQEGEEFPFEDIEEKIYIPDTYLEDNMRELPDFEARGLTVEPFVWSRDPDESDKFVPKLITHISDVVRKYQGTGRPICVMSHSWGTMLSHTALHRMPQLKKKVKVDRWITMGSPLMPGNFIVKIYNKLKVKQEDLEKIVSKPESVSGRWINIWAKHDIISNEIKAADENHQVDLAVAATDKAVVKYAKKHPLQFFSTRADLYRLRTTTKWHAAYMYDYEAYIKCLKKQVEVKIFEPLVDPSVTAGY